MYEDMTFIHGFFIFFINTVIDSYVKGDVYNENNLS